MPVEAWELRSLRRRWRLGTRSIATGRRPDEVATVLGESDSLLAVRLDVTSVDRREAAVEAAVERFGRIDVVVNNAGASFKGFDHQCLTRSRRVDVSATAERCGLHAGHELAESVQDVADDDHQHARHSRERSPAMPNDTTDVNSEARKNEAVITV